MRGREEGKGEGDEKSRLRMQSAEFLSFGDYHLSSEETVSFLRPWRRRDARTRRPLAELMRSRNPCLLTRLRFEGWNVLFISQFLYIIRQ